MASKAEASIFPDHTHSTNWLPIILVVGVIFLCCGGAGGGAYYNQDYALREELNDLKDKLGEQRDCRRDAAENYQKATKLPCDGEELLDCDITPEAKEQAISNYLAELAECDVTVDYNY